MALSVGVQPVLIPKTAKQAYECDNSDLWKQGFVEEFATLDTPMGKDKTKCVELVHKRDLPKGASILGSTYDIQYHFARECNQLGKTKVTEVHTQRQLADYLTKYISGTVLHRLTKAAFGYDKDFHFQEHKQPIAPMNNGLSKSKAK